jgi:hypothetical protein
MTTISLKRIGCLAAALLLTVTFSTVLRAQQLSRGQWGGVPEIPIDQASVSEKKRS